MNIKSVNIQITPEVSKQIESDLNNAIFHGELLTKYKTNEEVKQRYLRDIEILTSAKRKGYLDFTYENPEKPYDIHEICIEWKPDLEATDVEELSSYIYAIPIKEMRKILKVFEGNGDDFVWDVSKINRSFNVGSILTYEIYQPL